MTNDVKLISIYETLINDKVLTTSKLTELGISEEELTNYIEIGYLTKKEQKYELTSTVGLYEYGVKLQNGFYYGDAAKCFKLCLKINKDDYNSYLQLVNSDLKRGNLDEVYELVAASNNSIVNKEHDNNLHLLLLAGVKEITDKALIVYIKSLRDQDLMVVGEGPLKNKQNKIRKAIIDKKFKHALELLNDMRDLSIENTVLKTMLIENAQAQEIRKAKVKTLVNDHKYADLAKYLGNLEDCPGLNIIEAAVLFLARKLSNADEIIVSNENKSYDIFQTIYTGNYKQALLLSQEHTEKHCLKEENNVIYLLLLDINRLIDKRAKKSEPKEEIRSVEEIVNHLVKHEAFSEDIKEYLSRIGCSEYEMFILNLAKICSLHEDSNYDKLIKALKLLRSDSYKFEIGEYIHNFFLAISQNDFDLAELYLHIIASTKSFGKACEFYNDLEATLIDHKKKIGKSKIR